MIKENDIIDFDNGSYLVIDTINIKNKTYLYLINNDNYTNDTSIVELVANNKNVECKHIEDDKIFEYLLKKLYVNHKRSILTYFD